MDETEITAKDVREHELFKKQAQLAAELKRELEEYRAKEKSQQEELLKKQAEEQGNWKALLAEKEKELALQIEMHKREMLDRDLRIALVKEGVTNELFVKGALASFSGDSDSIADYVAQIKNDNATFFGSAPRIDPPSKTVPKMSSSTDWAAVRKNLTSSNTKQRTEAKLALDAYFAENQKLPW